jgi:hypothetical protein
MRPRLRVEISIRTRFRPYYKNKHKTGFKRTKINSSVEPILLLILQFVLISVILKKDFYVENQGLLSKVPEPRIRIFPAPPK